MTAGLTRRSILGTAGMIAAGTAIGWDPAYAQVAGGTLRVAMTAGAVPLPNGCPDQGAEGQRFMGITLFDQLIGWDLSKSDAPAALKPGIASEWKVDSANLKHWHFTLRPGVKFHDGTPVTADDITFSFDRAIKKDAPWFDPRAAGQVGLRVPTIVKWGPEGENGFFIETNVVDSTIPYAVTWIGIVPRHAWEAAGKSWDKFLDHAVGSGPWKMQSFSVRERCVLTRNADYWDKDRIPKCETLVLLPMPEATTRVAALRSGQVDFVEAPPPDAVPSLKGAGFRIVTNVYPHNWTWQLSRAEGSPFNDVRVRKAINLAIDRDGMKELLGGLMEVGEGLVYKGHPWYGHPTFELKHDPDAAKKLLADAGYGPSKPLSFKVAISTSGSGQMQPLSMNEFLQQNLAEVGVKVDFEVVDWNSLLDIWHSGAKAPLSRGCVGINVTFAAVDPYSAFTRLMKSDLVAPAGVNWGYFNDPKYDKWFQQVYETFDPKAQDALLGTIHSAVVDEALFLFVAHDLNPRALSPKVKGFVQAQSWFQDLTPISIS